MTDYPAQCPSPERENDYGRHYRRAESTPQAMTYTACDLVVLPLQLTQVFQIGFCNAMVAGGQRRPGTCTSKTVSKLFCLSLSLLSCHPSNLFALAIQPFLLPLEGPETRDHKRFFPLFSLVCPYQGRVFSGQLSRCKLIWQRSIRSLSATIELPLPNKGLRSVRIPAFLVYSSCSFGIICLLH